MQVYGQQLTLILVNVNPGARQN